MIVWFSNQSTFCFPISLSLPPPAGNLFDHILGSAAYHLALARVRACSAYGVADTVIFLGRQLEKRMVGT